MHKNLKKNPKGFGVKLLSYWFALHVDYLGL